jgi:hypothetical protein
MHNSTIEQDLLYTKEPIDSKAIKMVSYSQMICMLCYAVDEVHYMLNANLLEEA